MPACKHWYRLFVCVVSRKLLLLMMINYFCIYICHSAEMLSTQLICGWRVSCWDAMFPLFPPVHINLLLSIDCCAQGLM